VEEKTHPISKIKYQGGGNFRLPLLNYVVKFHRKNNLVEYPILICPLLKFPFPLIDDAIDYREWQVFPSSMGFNSNRGLALEIYVSQTKLGFHVLLFFFGLNASSD
jgi:hypothetical protein